MARRRSTDVAGGDRRSGAPGGATALPRCAERAGRYVHARVAVRTVRSGPSGSAAHTATRWRTCGAVRLTLPLGGERAGRYVHARVAVRVGPARQERQGVSSRAGGLLGRSSWLVPRYLNNILTIPLLRFLVRGCVSPILIRLPLLTYVGTRNLPLRRPDRAARQVAPMFSVLVDVEIECCRAVSE